MEKVGRYKQAKVYVREFDDVVIVLLNQETIYAMPTCGAPNIIYHRFFGPLGTYPEWRLFRNSLKYNKRLSMRKITTLAIRHKIQNFGTMRVPNLQGKSVEIETLKGGKMAKKRSINGNREAI